MLLDYNTISLDEWLGNIFTLKEKKDSELIDYQFATNEHFNEYINTIHKREDEEVKKLLKLFLLDACYLKSDDTLKSSLLSPSFYGREKLIKESVFLTKLISMKPPWSSLHWIIDLLPNFPQLAIQTIEAYISAHIQYLPDGRLTGLNDSIAIIQAKYIEHPLPVRQTLLDLKARDFEFLVAYLYMKKGYSIIITKQTHDGGYDIIAEKSNSREDERLHIDCKKYSNTIGVTYIRRILGTLNIHNATKSVIVGTAYYSRPAKKEAKKSKRMELVDIEHFDKDMRKFIDYNWIYKIDSYIKEMQKVYLDN